MSKFHYILKNRQGQIKAGTVESVNRADAVQSIKKPSWFVTELTEQKTFSLPFLSGQRKFSTLERIVFTDHLAAMFESGTPLVEALEAYQDEEAKRNKLIIDGLIHQVEHGKKLSEAMALYPQTFNLFYTALVQSGELTGIVGDTLKYIAQELRREHEFKEKIKTALFYPMFVLGVAFLVILLLVLVVIPKITLVMKSLSGNLPLATRIVAGAASFLTNYGLLLTIFFIGLVVGLGFFISRQNTRRKLDPYLLRFPLVGQLIKKYMLARLLRVVGSCIKYGVSMAAAFEIAGKVVSNIRYQEACDRIKAKITKGVSLSRAFEEEETAIIPRMIVRTVRGAERTGYVDSAMVRLSKFFEDDIDRQLKRITDLIEPILVIVLGLIVAAIAMAVIAPIYQMTSRIK